MKNSSFYLSCNQCKLLLLHIIFIYAVALAAMLNIFVPAAPALTALIKKIQFKQNGLNNGISYKSATPMKLNKELLPGSKKII